MKNFPREADRWMCAHAGSVEGLGDVDQWAWSGEFDDLLRRFRRETGVEASERDFHRALIRLRKNRYREKDPTLVLPRFARAELTDDSRDELLIEMFRDESLPAIDKMAYTEKLDDMFAAFSARTGSFWSKHKFHRQVFRLRKNGKLGKKKKKPVRPSGFGLFPGRK